MENIRNRTPFNFTFEGMRYSATYISHRFHDHVMYIVWFINNAVKGPNAGELFTFREPADPSRTILESSLKPSVCKLSVRGIIPLIISRLERSLEMLKENEYHHLPSLF